MNLKSIIFKMITGVIIIFIAFYIFKSLLQNIEILLLFFLLPIVLSYIIFNIKDIIKKFNSISRYDGKACTKLKNSASQKNISIDKLLLKPLINDALNLISNQEDKLKILRHNYGFEYAVKILENLNQYEY